MDLPPLETLLKIIRNRLLLYCNNFYWDMVIGDYTHNLRNDLIRLPAIMCEFGATNAPICLFLLSFFLYMNAILLYQKVSNAFEFTRTSKPQ